MPPVMESSDFTIRRKDFPALPGNVSTSECSSESSLSESSDEHTGGQRDSSQDQNTSASPEMNTSSEDRDLNTSFRVINDQFGMMGLLSFIRVSEARPSLGSLALGEDLTSLGLNLESSENLYSTFDGPWPGVADHNALYSPYKLTPGVRKRLASVFISKYEDDLLFYLFYASARDVIQLVAAGELYKRGWRYHTTQREWMCSLPGSVKLEKSSKFGPSTHYVFDVMSWKKVIKEEFLDCGQIEGQPIVPELFRAS